MSRFGTMCLVTGALCVAGGVLAADEAKKQVIPNFATTEKTGWVLDRSVGPDDLLPPPTGQQRSRARNGTLPAKTSSFHFFIDGIVQGRRIGLVRSATR